ncbi:hypothetical protein ACFWEH_12910 [Streptomyces anulatus]|uniref:hypothetical protein n=1 Tax=Streptomyces TaxID=1883 RepID=UPI00093DB7B6|nr:hypothetical protein [Streptomyces sp. TSRI0395]OKI83771.1 hypothetical protein AMK12_11640 [Streptomyces sp. TSRI0395]
MATFTSSKYPEITLQDDKGVWARFRAGRFETSDAGIAKRLRALPDGEGITEAGEPSPSAPDKAPAKSASKDTWVAWAVACGADEDEASKLTRDDLAEQYADAAPKE